MGNLLMQASIIGVYEKLTMAETLAAVTFRAAQALHLNDRGILRPGMLADFIAFPCRDYQEILYNQGGIMPEKGVEEGEGSNHLITSLPDLPVYNIKHLFFIPYSSLLHFFSFGNLFVSDSLSSSPTAFILTFR